VGGAIRAAGGAGGGPPAAASASPTAHVDFVVGYVFGYGPAGSVSRYLTKLDGEGGGWYTARRWLSQCRNNRCGVEQWQLVGLKCESRGKPGSANLAGKEALSPGCMQGNLHVNTCQIRGSSQRG
jgi:hypothetical protein